MSSLRVGRVFAAVSIVALLACGATQTDPAGPIDSTTPGEEQRSPGGAEGGANDGTSDADAGVDSGVPAPGDGPTIPPPPPATLWVATDGSDDNDGKSSSKPLRTIRRAAALVAPGDVVYIRGGTYKEYLLADAWVTSGEPGKPITFTGAPGEEVILDGSDRSPNPANPSAPQLIVVRDRDWYVFRDMTLRKAGGRGIQLQGDHHVLLNIVSHSNHGDGIEIKGSHNRVEGCTTYDNFSVLNGGDSADGIKITEGEGNVVRYVVAYENSDDGIDLWDSTDTLLEHCVAYSNGRGDTGNGQGFKLSNGSRNDARLVARYNVAYSNRASNFTDNGGGGITFYNNTSFNAGDWGFVFRGRTGKAVHTVSNNLSFQDTKTALVDIQTEGGALAVQNTNSWNLDVDDPKFESTTPGEPGFLRLSAGSPAIDVGTDVGQPFKGAAPDLGAFEAQ